MWWSHDDGTVTVFIRVQPGARRTEIIQVEPDRLRVRLAAPPVDGKANAALIVFVADLFGVRRSAVTLVRGERSRDKVLRVSGVSDAPEIPPTQ